MMKKEKTDIQQPHSVYSNRIFRDGRTVENVLSILQPGDELLMGNQLYNVSAEYILKTCQRVGVKVQQSEAKNANALLDNITKKTKMIWIESPSGPTLRVFDLPTLSAVARERDIIVVVDNTLGAPLLQNPSALGVDILLHRHIPALKAVSQQEVGVVLHGTKDVDFVKRAISRQNELDISPFFKTSTTWFDRFINEINQKSENTAKIARFLEGAPSVARVYYPGQPDHPNYALAKQHLKASGNVLSFYLEDDTPEAAERILKKSRLFNASMDNKGNNSLINHPSQTTFAHFPAYMKRRAGIRDSLLCLYIGKESVDELLEDLDRTL